MTSPGPRTSHNPEQIRDMGLRRVMRQTTPATTRNSSPTETVSDRPNIRPFIRQRGNTE